MEATKQQCPKCAKLFILDEGAFKKHVASCERPKAELQNFRPDDLRKSAMSFRRSSGRKFWSSAFGLSHDATCFLNAPSSRMKSLAHFGHCCFVASIPGYLASS